MKREPQQILQELLVLQSQAGDADSIAKMVQYWHPRFIRYAIKILGESELAHDVVQESWIAILSGIKKVSDPAMFRSWAFRIVHNKSYDAIRKNIRQRNVLNEFAKGVSAEPIAGNSETSYESAEAEKTFRLRAEIKKLNPKDQQLLGLYYDENLSIKEVCSVVGTTQSAIKSRLDRLRRKLKAILERKIDESRN